MGAFAMMAVAVMEEPARAERGLVIAVDGSRFEGELHYEQGGDAVVTRDDGSVVVVRFDRLARVRVMSAPTVPRFGAPVVVGLVGAGLMGAAGALFAASGCSGEARSGARCKPRQHGSIALLFGGVALSIVAWLVLLPRRLSARTAWRRRYEHGLRLSPVVSRRGGALSLEASF
ncbi:MAG: hypothetical protein JJ863_18635 [Deltaproteobacteria bacterium]|nr:hypothetical protein [Deltaproteobacteria bacterium]